MHARVHVGVYVRTRVYVRTYVCMCVMQDVRMYAGAGVGW